MFFLPATLIVLCLIVDSHEADKPLFAKGTHLLHTSFEKEGGRWNSNHNVKVQAKGEQLTLKVLDVQKKWGADKTEATRTRLAREQLSESDSANLPERESGERSLFAGKRSLNGIVDAKGCMRFGVTTVHHGKLVSLHFVGRTTLGGASGKVYLLSSDEPVREGVWYLRNPFSRGGVVPGFNGVSPFGG